MKVYSKQINLFASDVDYYGPLKPILKKDLRKSQAIVYYMGEAIFATYNAEHNKKVGFAFWEEKGNKTINVDSLEIGDSSDLIVLGLGMLISESSGKRRQSIERYLLSKYED